ncbi:MAG: leucine-rich repeat protein, partial [Proteobacteria bacterium]|nr:leucine-rich repeat protein [Pseudomonadota bacterium]
QTLYLNGNQLSRLSPNLFLRLNQLSWLDVRENQLKIIDEDAFSSLLNLTGLNLGSNQLSDLNPKVFAVLHQLGTIYLNNNELTNLNSELFSDLSELWWLDLSANRLDHLDKGIFSGLYKLQGVYLEDNQLDDMAISNLTTNMPYQINRFFLNNNQIENSGAKILAELMPCLQATFSLYGNPINDSGLWITLQQNSLQKVCEDQRCHANLPAGESCGVDTIDLAATNKHMTWQFDSSIEVEKIKSGLVDHSYWLYASETPPLQLIHALSDASSTKPSSSLPMSVLSGAIILGVAGLSILLCKNNTWMQAIVNIGNRFFQYCGSGRKSEKTKPSSLTHTIRSRYTFFPHLSSIFPVQRISMITKTTTPTP